MAGFSFARRCFWDGVLSRVPAAGTTWRRVLAADRAAEIARRRRGASVWGVLTAWRTARLTFAGCAAGDAAGPHGCCPASATSLRDSPGMKQPRVTLTGDLSGHYVVEE